MKKTLIVFMAVIIVALSIVGCSVKADNKITTYDIDINLEAAQIDETVKPILAKVVQKVNIVNYYNSILDTLEFHLFTNAYRETARFRPIEDKDKLTAYPNGESWGGITIDRVTINNREKEYAIEGQDEDILRIDLEERLEPTMEVEVTLEYQLSIPRINHRFGYNDKTINLGNFYPVLCVYENGNYNTNPYYNVGDPFYTNLADYNVSVTYPSSMEIATSGVIQENTVVENTATRKYALENARDFAIVIGDMKKITGSVGDVAIEYFYNNDTEIDQTVTTIIDAINTFTNKFGKYEYNTISVVETAFVHGGMEYPALIYISNSNKGNLMREVVVHEIAHQWWYAMVGNNQTQSAWLDEGLTEYSTTLFYEWNPQYNVTRKARIADSLTAFIMYSELNINKDTSMNRKLGDYTSSLEYAYTTYLQGQLMLDSIRNLIGDESFFAALKSYFDNNKNTVATPDSLIAELTSHTKINIENYINSWIDGLAIVYN